MPSKKKKFNARFPPARIKKIMQTDEDIGKVSQAVPVLISKALEIFLEALVRKAHEKTKARNAKTMTRSHIKQCIENESKFDFLKDLVENVPDMPCEEDETNNEMQSLEPKPKQARRGRPPKTRQLEAGSSSSSRPNRQSSEEASFSEDESEESEDETTASEDNLNQLEHARLQESRKAIEPEVREAPTTLMQPNHLFQSVPTSGNHGDNSLVMGFYQPSQSQRQSNNDDEDYDC